MVLLYQRMFYPSIINHLIVFQLLFDISHIAEVSVRGFFEAVETQFRESTVTLPVGLDDNALFRRTYGFADMIFRDTIVRRIIPDHFNPERRGHRTLEHKVEIQHVAASVLSGTEKVEIVRVMQLHPRGHIPQFGFPLRVKLQSFPHEDVQRQAFLSLVFK